MRSIRRQPGSSIASRSAPVATRATDANRLSSPVPAGAIVAAMPYAPTEIAAALGRVPLFAGISAESMARLAAVTGEQDFEPGHFIVLPGPGGNRAVRDRRRFREGDARLGRARCAGARTISSVSCRSSTSSRATPVSRQSSRPAASPWPRGTCSISWKPIRSSPRTCSRARRARPSSTASSIATEAL